jgi:iron complex transport system substrate-binding protein|uniref:Putative Periplasmic binding protein n=1 Tax=uncultured marine crenarchaeote HF4000_ANIW141J13 TaxID=455577 RepID=B3T5J6_9ARCH|nr:putative Periplasmic binding protein [uncultured marine crenarchaeote HF4000_ANIW141J13]
MEPQRIVTFLPSATELIYSLGAEDRLFGVTHECNYPSDAKTKPRVISSVFDPASMSSKQIDDKICQLMSEGKEIYSLNKENLLSAKPDLIISQNICEVCSAHTEHVNMAVEMLEKKPEVYTMDPHDVSEILTSIKDISKIIGKEKEGNGLIDSLSKRLEFVRGKTFEKKQKVVAIEWVDPFFTSGHWIPEMIEVAGGENLISLEKMPSRKMKLEEIKEANPDIIVVMPCGFDVKRTINEYKKVLAGNPEWNELKAVKENNVYAVDANSYFSKPSLRTITGIEILASIFHPDVFGDLQLPEDSFMKIN